MPGIAFRLRAGVDTAIGISAFAETHARPERKQRPGTLSSDQIEAVYELSMLRIFMGWEVFLESAFCYYSAGFASPSGDDGSCSLSPYASPVAAIKMALDGKKYFNWADPDILIRLCETHLSSSHFLVVLQTARNDLDAYKAIRDRVAHTSPYSRNRFLQGTQAITGSQARSDIPGKFLRAWAPAQPDTPQVRWLIAIGGGLVNLAEQIAP